MGQVPIKGKHKHRYENGDVYEGFYDQSQRHGYGVLVSLSGDCYKGNWLNDQKWGEGTQTSSSNNNEKNAEVLPDYIPNNHLSLRNRMWHRAQYLHQKWRQDQTELANVVLGDYNGFFLSNSRNAFGTFSYANNSFFYGEWSSDKRSGLGVLLSKSLDEYEGQFKANAMQGWGIQRLNCHDREAVTLTSLNIRKNVLRYQVMAHLYKNKLKQPLPSHYQLPNTFLLDGLIVVPGSKSTNPTLEIGIADIGAFTRPSQQIQNEQTIHQLLEYAIQTIQAHQLLMQRYETLLFISHELEVEGLWVANQLSGPVLDPQVLQQSLSTQSPDKPKPNLDGFCIVRKYTRLTDDNSQEIYQLQQQFQNDYHTSSNPHQVTRYATIVTQQSVQYLVEIRIVNVKTARRVVETYGKIDLDLLEAATNTDLTIADDEFDDMMASGVDLDHDGVYSERHSPSDENSQVLRTPQRKKHEGATDGTNVHDIDHQLDTLLGSSSTPNIGPNDPAHNKEHSISKQSGSAPFPTPQVPDYYHDTQAFAPSIDFVNEDGAGTGGIEITLDLDEGDGSFAMKTVQDAVNRVEQLLGNDNDNGDFAIGDDDE